MARTSGEIMPEPVIVEDVCVGCGAKTLRTKFSAKSCEICGRTTARRCGTEDQFHDDVKTAVLKIKERGYAFFRNKQIYRELKRMGYQDSDKSACFGRRRNHVP